MADSASRREGGSGSDKIYDKKNGAHGVNYLCYHYTNCTDYNLCLGENSWGQRICRPDPCLDPYPSFSIYNLHLTCMLVYAGSRARRHRLAVPTLTTGWELNDEGEKQNPLDFWPPGHLQLDPSTLGSNLFPLRQGTGTRPFLLSTFSFSPLGPGWVLFVFCPSNRYQMTPE